MAIKYAATKFPQMEIGYLLAQDYGEHILSVTIEEDTPNGYHFKPGKMTSLDNWEMEEATEIDAYIALKDASGRYLVVINDPKGVGVIYQKPLNNVESPRELALASNFYNDPADGAVRGYMLHAQDRYWLTADNFNGEPKVDGTITTISDGKLTVA
nr:MAG TPA: hypothetical protein [Caudoviricetes sp.]